MRRTSSPVEVATTAPLLRLVGLLVAVLAGVAAAFLASSAWLALGLALVAVPMVAVVEGGIRSRRASRSTAASASVVHARRGLGLP